MADNLGFLGKYELVKYVMEDHGTCMGMKSAMRMMLVEICYGIMMDANRPLEHRWCKTFLSAPNDDYWLSTVCFLVIGTQNITDDCMAEEGGLDALKLAIETVVPRLAYPTANPII